MGKSEQSPLERAARALCSYAGLPENASQNGKPLWQDFLPEVRITLQALREPSEAMLVAGEAHLDEAEPLRAVDLLWKDMVDAALAQRSDA